MGKIAIATIMFVTVLFAQPKLKHFKFQKTIKIDEEILLSGISTIDFKDKLFLIDDLRGEGTYLINFEGKLVKMLDPRKDHPGLNWHPTGAFFTSYNEILVLNGFPWGIRFNEEGEYIDLMHNSFTGGDAFCFNKNKLIVYKIKSDDKKTICLISLNSRNGELIKIYDSFTKRNIHAIDRIGTGGLCCNSRSIFNITPLDYKIREYNLDGKFISEFGIKPSFYRRFPDIKNDSNPMKIIIDLAKKFEEYYKTENIFLTENNKLVITYSQKKNWGIQIYSSNRELLGEEKFFGNITHTILKKDKLYVVNWPLEDDEEINPSIWVYKIEKK